MKFIATGDNHFAEGARWDECIFIHHWLVQLIEAELPDAVFFGGDLFDAASTPTERAAVANMLVQIADVAPVLITKGNHDRPLDCALLGKLKARHPITVEEACGVHVIGGIAVAAVAWPSLGSLAAMLKRPLAGAAMDDVAREELRGIFLGLGQELDRHNLPKLMLGHFMIDGAVLGTGQPLVGAQLNVTLADLGLARAQMVLASHIHAPQEWYYNDQSIAYMGSPYRTDFGEMETKSVIVGEIATNEVSWWRVPTPAAPMVHLQGVYDAEFGGIGTLTTTEPKTLRGAEVRLRYETAADTRDAAKAAAHQLRTLLLRDGARSVKVEEVVLPQVRARAPEVAHATTLEGKLAAVWNAKGIVVSAERRARLLSKLGEVI